MTFLIRLKKERAVVFSVLVALLSLTAMIGASLLTAAFVPVLGTEYYTLLLAQESISIVVMLAIAFASKTAYTITRKGAGLGHSVQVAAYPLVLIGMVAMSMAYIGMESGEPMRAPLQIVIFVLSMLSIGVLEELVFRGIIAETLIAHYGTDYKGVWKATAVGGVIFGVAHLTNIFSASPFGVIIQVLVAGVIGMLFAAIYYRTGNLWICILLHAGLDCASLLDVGVFESTSTISDVVSSFDITNLIPCITYGLPILFLLRRKKNKEVQLWFGAIAQDTPQDDTVPVEPQE